MATAGSVLGVIRAARPALRSPHDAVAFAVHAAFLSVGYSLTAAGSRAASSPPEGRENVEVGIEGWNDIDGVYAFQYSGAGQDGLCKSVLVKCVPVGDSLMLDAAPDDGGDKEPLHLEIKASDYVATLKGDNYGQVYQNLNELIERINSSLLSKNSAPTKTQSLNTSRGRKEVKAFDEDDFEVEGLGPLGPRIDEQPPFTPEVVYPPVPPIGGSDLLPGPGAGVFPNRFDPGFEGLLVGPNDPRWGVGVGYDATAGFAEGGRGIPPGARFDPFGPPAVPGFEPSRFTRDRRPPGRGVHPDLEHFQPF